MATATTLRYATRNDLSESIRVKMDELLNATLADAIDLQLQAKQAHWNVKGPDFIALHKLFDEVYQGITEYVDGLAERCVQLGGIADGTLSNVSRRTRLPAYPLQLADGKSHVEALSAALAAFGKTIRAAIDEAGNAGDMDTADLFTEISRGTDKWLWFVEAHLQGG